MQVGQYALITEKKKMVKILGDNYKISPGHYGNLSVSEQKP